MIHSMTGFASKTFTLSTNAHHNALITVHIKTLNSRFFEAQMKVAHIFSHLETKISTLLKNNLKRGFVTISLYVDNKNLFKGSVQADMSTVHSYVQAINQIQKECILPGSVTINDIIALPNVFSSNDLPLDQAVEQEILENIAHVVTAVLESRALEGVVLSKDLQERIALMESEIKHIEYRAQILLAEQKEKVSMLNAQTVTETDPQSEARKTIMYATLDKMDIHEEIVRFKNHLKNLIDQLNASTIEKGKRLDFTLQELAREINTISAKCADGVLGTHAINIKVELEKAREQAQNIV